MNEPLSKRKLKKLLKGGLSEPIDDQSFQAIYNNLERRGYLDTEEYELYEIIEEAQFLVKDFGDAFQSKPYVPPTGGGEGHNKEYRPVQDNAFILKQQAISEIVSEEASEDEEVVALRKEIRSEEHTSELQSHSFISYAVFCLKKKNKPKNLELV